MAPIPFRVPAFWCVLVLAFCLSTEGWGAGRRDYKGLFGSYRREKFTENEARGNDFGIDLSISTLLPVSQIVNSFEGARADLAASNGSSMQYSSFFNGEIAFTYSFGYAIEAFGMLGYFSYETRKQNQSSIANPTQPFFHQASFSAIPILGGIRYRFTTSDIVPYLTVGAGVSLIRRRAFYDYAPNASEESLTTLTGYGGGGFEFFISARTGIRLEVSAMVMATPRTSFDLGAPPSDFPVMLFQSNITAVRYSSGLFLLL